MPSDPFHWPSQPPGDCPFEPSDSLAGIRFTGRHAEYTDADTWYPSWASDGHLYSSWTDGTVNGIQCHSFGKEPATGWARIVGDDPMKLEFADASTHPASPAPYGGRYPCAYLVHDGVSYCGTYCLNDGGKGLNWDILGPFVGFRWSVDFGKTWTQTPHTPATPIFGESEKRNGKVKFGAPHFVDFGRNMEHSPDGKAYLVGHGAVDPDPAPRDAKLSWITGDQIYLARVTPSVENINDASKYEFFARRDRSGEALWDNKLADARPIAEWINNMGCVTITFVAALNKYILCVTDGGNTIGMFNTYLLESDDVCGPWRLVHYWRQFGRQAYFVNIPTKFLSSDGQRGWLCYSANFNHRNKAEWIAPPGSRYAMCLQEFRFAKA